MMPDLAWDELLQQEEAEELQAGCIVRKKLFSKAVSFGLSVPLPLETGQGCAVPFLLCYATREALSLLFCALLLCVAAPQGLAEGHVPCLRGGDLISETSHTDAFGNLGTASVCDNHYEVRTVL